MLAFKIFLHLEALPLVHLGVVDGSGDLVAGADLRRFPGRKVFARRAGDPAGEERAAVHPLRGSMLGQGEVRGVLPILPPSPDDLAAPRPVVQFARLLPRLTVGSYPPGGYEDVRVDVAVADAALDRRAMNCPLSGHAMLAAQPFRQAGREVGLGIERKLERKGEDNRASHHGVTSALGRLGGVPVYRTDGASREHVFGATPEVPGPPAGRAGVPAEVGGYPHGGTSRRTRDGLHGEGVDGHRSSRSTTRARNSYSVPASATSFGR